MPDDIAPQAATPGQAANPGWEVPAPGMPWTPPQSVSELPAYWRARAEGAQRGASARSVDYNRGKVFQRCADDLAAAVDALTGDAAAREEAAGLRGQHDRLFREHVTAEQEHKEIRDGLRGQLAASERVRADYSRQLDALRAELEQARRRLALIGEVQAQLGAVYRERACLVAFLGGCYPAVKASDDTAPGWPVIYVETPSGQMSWHVSMDDVELFAHIGQDDEHRWDGHTTEAKYARLAELTRALADAGGIRGIGLRGQVDVERYRAALERCAGERYPGEVNV